MEERATPALVTVDPSDNITSFVVRNAAERADHPAILLEHPGEWKPLSSKEFYRDCVELAQGFASAGIEPGDRVLIMSRTRYEWTLTDFALWFAGAVPVPVYETSSAGQVSWIASDSGAVAAVAESRELTALIEQSRAEAPALRQIWTIEDGGLDELRRQGREIPESEIDRRSKLAGLDSEATIIYTSGTTGRPKGCVLTHGNFSVLSANLHALLPELLDDPEASALLFLPLAHVLARLVGVLLVTSSVTIAHCSDPSRVVEMCGKVRPTLFLAVPRVLEKVYNAAEQKAEASGKGKLFARAAATAVEYSRAQDTDGPVPLGLRLRHALFNRLVYPKLRGVLGGRAKFAISGGGPLGERLGHFYRGIGLIVLEGYGLTESTAPTAVNVPRRSKIGTVGPPIPGTAIRISDTGEVLLKGPHIFTRYLNNPEATAEALVDGWLHTGDLGQLDEDGYLRITGRAKEILVTAGGKNVAPAVLEDRLRAHPLISQCMVVGDGRPYIGALITLDPDMLTTWLANNGLPEMGVPEATKNAKVLEALDAAIADANTVVSRAESIRRYEVLQRDFTIEDGYLTPSQKLKRADVMKDFAEDVERLYPS